MIFFLKNLQLSLWWFKKIWFKKKLSMGVTQGTGGVLLKFYVNNVHMDTTLVFKEEITAVYELLNEINNE